MGTSDGFAFAEPVSAMKACLSCARVESWMRPLESPAAISALVRKVDWVRGNCARAPWEMPKAAIQRMTKMNSEERAAWRRTRGAAGRRTKDVPPGARGVGVVISVRVEAAEKKRLKITTTINLSNCCQFEETRLQCQRLSSCYSTVTLPLTNRYPTITSFCQNFPFGVYIHNEQTCYFAIFFPGS